MILQQAHKARLFGGQLGMLLCELLETLKNGTRLHANDGAQNLVKRNGLTIEFFQYIQTDIRVLREYQSCQVVDFLVCYRLGTADFFQYGILFKQIR